ncbi:unnamed protein product, partial [Polarella glacialis]
DPLPNMMRETKDQDAAGSASATPESAARRRLTNGSEQPVKMRRTETEMDQDPALLVINPEFVRAVTLQRILSRFGKYWRSSKGSDHTFEMSHPASKINFFLSHSWMTNWKLKVLALVYYFNVKSAVLSAILVHVAYVTVHGLLIEGEYMVADSYMFREDKAIRVVMSFRFMAGCFTFLVALLLAHYSPFVKASCFLDKMCIEQTNQEKKDQGVKQLGAAIRYSEHLMVLWQPEYLTRVWCVFELAAFAFMHSHRADALVILPLKLPVLAVSLFIFHFVASVSLVILSPFTFLSEWHAKWIVQNVPAAAQYFYYWHIIFLVCFFGMFLVPSFFLWRFCKGHVK